MEKEYNIVYKTICKIDSSYYIGIHSTDEIDDGYIGSGVNIKRKVAELGAENFYKEVLFNFKTRAEALEKEREIVNKKRIKDDLCLNSTSGGGGCAIFKYVIENIWTKENVLKEAKKFETPKEWSNKSNSSYNAACRKGYLKEATSHMTKRRNNWSDEELIEISGNFETLKEWRKVDKKSYDTVLRREHLKYLIKEKPDYSEVATNEMIREDALKYKTKFQYNKKSPKYKKLAYNRGILDDVTKHMTDDRVCITDEEIKQDRLKYKSLTEWRLKSSTISNIANKRGLFEEEWVGKIGRSMSKKDILEIIRDFKSIAEWREKDISSYTVATKKKWLEELTEGMEREWKFWTEEEIIEQSKKFKTVEEWRDKCSKSYQQAHKTGIYQNILKKGYLSGGRPEITNQEIIEEAKKYITVKDYKSNSPYYNRSKNRNIYKKCTEHMKKHSRA